ncbi:DUF1016 N-terminal domain-containing protein [Bradyrhizobium iriomotense]|uniref:DUF1016 N-terminal domain-containing protein n=1 Tax=Bradyrhizobium iriomotense TaxID=441950 RepID=UPI0024E04D6F|nr:DUF1016 N-terminal domain-containing protein [Bradyrhizobium iriomotense]
MAGWRNCATGCCTIALGHNVHLLDAAKAPEEHAWYARQAIEHGWSRNVLIHQIDSNLLVRQGSALTSFSQTLPAQQSEPADPEEPLHLSTFPRLALRCMSAISNAGSSSITTLHTRLTVASASPLAHQLDCCRWRHTESIGSAPTAHPLMFYGLKNANAKVRRERFSHRGLASITSRQGEARSPRIALVHVQVHNRHRLNEHSAGVS